MTELRNYCDTTTRYYKRIQLDSDRLVDNKFSARGYGLKLLQNNYYLLLDIPTYKTKHGQRDLSENKKLRPSFAIFSLK
jgi:hypothetical protein